MHKHIILGCAAIAIALAQSAPVQAQSIRCVGKDGRKYYGQTLPRQCTGMAYERLDAFASALAQPDFRI